jgi:hypothetical protein
MIHYPQMQRSEMRDDHRHQRLVTTLHLDECLPHGWDTPGFGSSRSRTPQPSTSNAAGPSRIRHGSTPSDGRG